MKKLFTEKQKFNQWWIWIVPILIALIAVYGVIQQVIFGIEFGDNPMSDLGIIIFTILSFGFVYFFWCMTLTTEINEQGITIRFIPFMKKSVKWNDISSAKIVNYGFVGYGIRIGTKYGTVYNIKGNKGIAIELNSGKKFVIGTQQEALLNTIINNYLKA